MNTGGIRFETRVFAESAEVSRLVADLPGVRRALFETGVPVSFLNGGPYNADQELTVLSRAGDAPLVRFGTSTEIEAIGIDVGSGSVLVVGPLPSMPPILVNTTVDLFTSTVRALIERFPYYGKDASWAEMDSAADDLRDIVRSLDPPAAELECYWPTLIDHVQDGDFSTELVLD